MLPRRNRRRKNKIILCELYNEKIHGHCPDNGEIINTHYFVIQKIKDIFENEHDVYGNDDDNVSQNSLDNEDEDIVKLLIQKNARLDVRDKLSRTALRIALDNGYENIAELLRQAGAK